MTRSAFRHRIVGLLAIAISSQQLASQTSDPQWLRRVSWRTPRASIEQLVASLKPRQRVLLYYPGGGAGGWNGLGSHDVALLTRVQAQQRYTMVIAFDQPEEPWLSVAALSPRIVSAPALVANAVRRRTQLRPDGFGYSAGARLARGSLEHGTQYNRLLAVELPSKLPWVSNRALTPRERHNAGEFINIHFQSSLGRSRDMGLLNGLPIDGAINVNVGDVAHWNALTSDRVYPFIARGLSGTLSSDAPKPSVRRTSLPPRMQSLPFLPPLGPGGGAGIASDILLAHTDRDLGGVDLTDLRLKYLSDGPSDDQVPVLNFAFELHAPLAGARDGAAANAAQQSFDAVLVWLRTDPAAAFANLNPAEPERTIHPSLRNTDVGRVLLGSDLAMKRSVGAILHPDSALGSQFWATLRQSDDSRRNCFSFRLWIVPGDVSVWSDANGVYIASALLDVKMEQDYLRLRSSSQSERSCARKQAGSDIETSFRSLILPDVVRRVNTAPQYAELRAVFHARIVADWLRQNAATTSGVIARMQALDPEVPARIRWSPEQMFAEYVRSLNHGEFRVSQRSVEGNRIAIRTYVYGGVDFTNIPIKRLDSRQLRAQDPQLDRRVLDALLDPRGSARGDVRWVGGSVRLSSAPR